MSLLHDIAISGCASTEWYNRMKCRRQFVSLAHQKGSQESLLRCRLRYIHQTLLWRRRTRSTWTMQKNEEIVRCALPLVSRHRLVLVSLGPGEDRLPVPDVHERRWSVEFCRPFAWQREEAERQRGHFCSFVLEKARLTIVEAIHIEAIDLGLPRVGITNTDGPVTALARFVPLSSSSVSV